MLGTFEGVGVWRFELDVDPEELTACWAVLSADERARAGRLRPGPRERRVVAWARLRELLGGATGSPPASLRFETGPHGKPRLPGGPRFNLSHSEGVALCAIAPAREIGVDVEALRPVPEAALIAARWIGEAASAALRGAAGDRDAVFLRMWTRRESVLKGTGLGLAAAEETGPELEAAWTVVDLEPGPGYVGALALERAGEDRSRGAGA